MTEMKPNTWHTIPTTDSDGYMATSTVARILRGLPCEECGGRGDEMLLQVRDDGETWLSHPECLDSQIRVGEALLAAHPINA